MRISDWSSDVCSSDLAWTSDHLGFVTQLVDQLGDRGDLHAGLARRRLVHRDDGEARRHVDAEIIRRQGIDRLFLRLHDVGQRGIARLVEAQVGGDHRRQLQLERSEEHTSELQSLMRISYAVFCLKKKTNTQPKDTLKYTYVN